MASAYRLKQFGLLFASWAFVTLGACDLHECEDAHEEQIRTYEVSLLQVQIQHHSSATHADSAAKMCSPGDILFFGGLTSHDRVNSIASDEVMVLGSATDSVWQLKPDLDMPYTRSGHSTVAHDSNVYILGGYVNNSRSNSMIVLDLMNKSYRETTPTRDPRVFSGAAVVDDKIYVIGSQGPQGTPGPAENTMEIFDVNTEQWQDGPPIPGRGREGAIAIPYGRDIYVVGGIVKDVHIFNIENNTWRDGPAMPAGFQYPAASLVDDAIYFFGGNNDTAPFWPEAVAVGNAYMLDLSTNKWSVLPDLPMPRAVATSAVRDKDIYIIGGESKHLYHLDDVTIFNTVTKTYRSAPALPTIRSDASAVTAITC